MLNRWVGGKEPRAILNRLASVDSHGGLEFPVFLGLMKKVVNNREFPLTERQVALRTVADLAGLSQFEKAVTAKEEQLAMAWLADQVRDQVHQEVRLEAAMRLRLLAEKDPRAAEVIKKLLDSIQDDKVKAALHGK
jgi:hypothetical protein